MTDFPYNFEDVLNILRIPYHRRGSDTQIDCPRTDLHGGANHKKKLTINFKKDCFRCPVCDWSGGMLSFYAYYQNCTTKEANKEIMDYLQIGTTKDSPMPKRPPRKTVTSLEVEETPIAPIEVRHKCYTQLISVAPLDERHYTELLQRGLTKEQIAENGYCSTGFSLEPMKKAPDGIPGLYTSKRGIELVPLPPGYMIPVRNHERKIQGIQIRVNNEAIKDGRKYLWLSSKNFQGGTPAETFVHWACDWKMQDATWMPVLEDCIIVTEGPLKGDIIHALTGKPVLAVPGVNALSHLREALLIAASYGVTTVWNAYDMDYLTNPTVQQAIEKYNKLMDSLNLTNVRLTWDATYKGLDDYKLAKRKGI